MSPLTFSPHFQMPVAFPSQAGKQTPEALQNVQVWAAAPEQRAQRGRLPISEPILPQWQTHCGWAWGLHSTALLAKSVMEALL